MPLRPPGLATPSTCTFMSMTMMTMMTDTVATMMTMMMMMVTLMVTMMVVMMLTHIDKILAAAITQSVKSEGAHKCQIDIGSLAPKMM